MLLKIVFLAFGVALGLSGLTYAFFWFETASSPHRAYLDRLFRGKTGRALTRLIFSSAGSLILVIAFSPFAFWRKLWKASPDPACTLPPVILVHGLYHNASAWVLYRWWLRRAGFRNVYAFSYNSWTSSFHDLLERLDLEVAKVTELPEGRRVMLVGHSLGGLLSRAYVECAGNTGRIQAVAALGAPHQGSKLAALGLGSLAQSLIYRGPLISRLEEEARKTDVPCLSISSPVDNMVLPNNALRPPHAGWEYRESAPVSHVGMLYHRPTAIIVVDYLLSHSERRAFGQGSKTKE